MKYIWEARDIRSRPLEKRHGKTDTLYRYRLDVELINGQFHDIALFDEKMVLILRKDTQAEVAEYLTNNDFIPVIGYL